MGKLVILLALGLALALGIVSGLINNRLADAVETTSVYFEKSSAKNIASSVVEIYIKKLRSNRNLTRKTYQVSSIMDGNASITITQKSPAPNDTVLLYTVGRYGRQTDTIRNVLVYLHVPITVTGAISVSSTASLGSGKISIQNASSKITGINYDPHTGLPDGSCPSVHGISMESRSDVSYPSLNFNNVLVTGVRGGPNPPDTIALGNNQPNYDFLPAEFIPQADRVISGNISGDTVRWGTEGTPQVTYVHWTSGGQISVSAPVVGVGILILDGKVNISNTLHWEGLVLVVGNSVAANSDVRISNQNNSYGAIIMTGPNVGLQLPGSADFKY